MPSWRFSTSSRNRDSLANRLPRYSDLSQPLLPDAQSSVHCGLEDGTDNTDSASITSFGSQATLPAYAVTADLLNRLSIISPSMVTLSRPPQYYSGTPQNGDRHDRDRDETPDSEYTFTISSGFKSKPWATLRLHDGESRVASRAAGKGRRHPRFSNIDKIIGSVELSLNRPQTIKCVELLLKGMIVAGVTRREGVGSDMFLEHKYTLWDRKFGDPRLLSSESGQLSTARFDGRLSGCWTFPFAIPFPAHVDLSTRRAVHATGCEGPIRFLPECTGPPATPFRAGGPPQVAGGIAPFDIATTHVPTEKRKMSFKLSMPVSSQIGDLVLPTPARAAPIQNAQERITPTTPSLVPYTIKPHERSSSEPRSPSDVNPGNAHSPQPSSPGPSDNSLGRTEAKGKVSRRMAIKPGSDLPLSDTSYLLPQSFLEREVMANIHYELCLIVTHGALTTTESCVQSTIVYEPTTTPPPMPPDRHVFLRRKAIPHSPNVEPNIWKALSSTWIRGTYLDQHAISVRYTLHAALPLSYARGTLVPCALTIMCENPDALKFFANPRTPRVRLKRLTCLPQHHGMAETSPGGWPDEELTARAAIYPLTLGPLESRDRPRPPKDKSNSRNRAAHPFTPEFDDVNESDFLGLEKAAHEQVVGECAVWCTPEHYAQEAQVKRLYGEIHLPKGLQPTCTFPLFKILYRLELLAPAPGAFVPDASPAMSQGPRSDEHVYACCFVEITTETRGDEPRPVPLVGSLARPMGSRAPNNARRSQSQYWARYGFM